MTDIPHNIIRVNTHKHPHSNNPQ